MKNISYIALVALSVCSTPSFASSNNITKQFEKFDRNQNGLLSRAETASDPALWSRFASYDKDKDGHLSLSEFTLYASQ
jgi:Ca2+-binding EF-hand superfamily protein